jgi:peptidoglycan/LPS O-acetylase OafA/YrhL
MEKVSTRIPSLDGLRTISIALVVISHVFHSFGKTDTLFLGNLGVRVFFVISGFLITGLLLKEEDKNGKINLLKFYFRRTFRIFPPFYFYLSVMFLLTLLNVFEIPLKSFLYSSFYISNYFDPVHWNLTHTWSLSVEEQFYLLFPGLLFIFGRKISEKVLLAVVLLTPFIRYADYIIFENGRWMNMGFHQTMDALAIGCLLAMFYKKLHANNFYLKLLNSKLVILLPILILFCNLTGEHPKVYALACSVMNISIAFCIDWAVTNYKSNAGKLLNSKPMISLGMMSYSIYLWQQPFFEDNPQLFWTRFPFNFIGLAVMSLISYHFVEKYFLKLRPKFEGKLINPKTILQQKQLKTIQR